MLEVCGVKPIQSPTFPTSGQNFINQKHPCVRSELEKWCRFDFCRSGENYLDQPTFRELPSRVDARVRYKTTMENQRNPPDNVQEIHLAIQQSPIRVEERVV